MSTFSENALAAQPFALAVAVLVDLAIGDPVYRFHPVRLIGGALAAVEKRLRALGADGYGGGIVLFLVLALGSVAAVVVLVTIATILSPAISWVVHAFILYSLLALGDLLHHVWRVERALARNDLWAARTGVANLVGRDTADMDAAACRRTAIESLSENLTDGYISALFWYVLGGLPGLIVFKVVSTMDSLVGFRTPAYLCFGWCGARLDDAMNFLPARLTWLLIALVAGAVPGCSARKALIFGFRHARLLPSPNSGWSEAAMAGAIQRRLVGPIWKAGVLVTNVWIGDADDSPAATRADLVRAMVLAVAVSLFAGALAVAAVAWLWR